jgi:hypothetical protein
MQFTCYQGVASLGSFYYAKTKKNYSSPHRSRDAKCAPETKHAIGAIYFAFSPRTSTSFRT